MRFFGFFHVLLALTVNEILSSRINDSINDPCTAKDGTSGTIQIIGFCKHVKHLKDSNQTDELRKYKAGKIGRNHVYCCPQHKSVKACRSFGTRQDLRNNGRVKRIIGGIKSELGEFPHFVALGFINQTGHLTFDCGGSLISESFVITAAHCCSSRNKMPIIARLGKVS